MRTGGRTGGPMTYKTTKNISNMISRFARLAERWNLLQMWSCRKTSQGSRNSWLSSRAARTKLKETLRLPCDYSIGTKIQASLCFLKPVNASLNLFEVALDCCRGTGTFSCFSWCSHWWCYMFCVLSVILSPTHQERSGNLPDTLMILKIFTHTHTFCDTWKSNDFFWTPQDQWIEIISILDREMLDGMLLI